ncbi:acyl-CoA thiolesterase II, partial [Mucor mucedo]|uniref:acyl-CoA thiolesterase II n=1 Tax=Mucor mucedo TaxID=29922 RepID=UPI002220EAD8
MAYASDRGFLDTAARANGTSYNSENIGMMMSLDHSMWFHKPARVDDWLLFDMEGPRSRNGRGLVFGKIYNRDGCLVASAAQEGIIRLSQVGQERMMARPEVESKL